MSCQHAAVAAPHARHVVRAKGLAARSVQHDKGKGGEEAEDGEEEGDGAGVVGEALVAGLAAGKGGGQGAEPGHCWECGVVKLWCLDWDA